MAYKQRRFTVIELLFAIAIIAVLASILLPDLSDSRKRARFVRWLQFNKQCSNDPSCVVNLNFQEGEGNTLINSAQAYEAEDFNVNEYNGMVKGDYEWSRGRWSRGKRALQLDGASTYIEFPETEHVNFAGENDFTVMLSVKFDVLNKWDGLFGKCYMRNAVNGYPQYALYFDGTKKKNNSDKLFQMDIGTTSVLFSAESKDGAAVKPLDNNSWNHIVMRNKVVDGKQVIDLFINGVKLKSTYKNYGPGKKQREPANLAIGCIRWLLVENNNSKNNDDANDNNDKRAPNGKPDNFLKGKIDEFMVYNRALKDSEIQAHYLMGSEYL